MCHPRQSSATSLASGAIHRGASPRHVSKKPLQCVAPRPALVATRRTLRPDALRHLRSAVPPSRVIVLLRSAIARKPISTAPESARIHPNQAIRSSRSVDLGTPLRHHPIFRAPKPTFGMTAEIQTRFESKSFYELVQRSSFKNPGHEAVSRYLALRKPSSPLPTMELDEDSFDLAYYSWSSFVEHALGHYASCNPDAVATVYTYITGPRPSVNSSHGEGHQKLGWHNAVFFGVVGRSAVLETIRLALVGGAGVPDDLISSLTVNADKRPQIHCAQSPDYIAFDRMGTASFHLEDGFAWAPHEQGTWYTHKDWRPPT